MNRRVDMNQDTFVNRLLEVGAIERVRRGWYIIPRSVAPGRTYNRRDIVQIFGIEVAPGRYIFQRDVVAAFGVDTPAFSAAFGRSAAAQQRRLRTIDRNRYHSQDRNISEALARIPYDADGVRRSYGIEYEIYSLTREQESELAYLLDTLPPHVTEMDGSLSTTGVEIVFEPMSKELAIKTVKALRKFVDDNGVQMDGTGMHITFGVSNSEVSESDLVIRTNRLALAVKAVGTKRAIEELFGRDFTDYARLPHSLVSEVRHRAFNVRNRHAWEARLVKYNCNIEKVMKFFEVAEVLFHRPFEAQDFMKVFELLGADTWGA